MWEWGSSSCSLLALYFERVGLSSGFVGEAGQQSVLTVDQEKKLQIKSTGAAVSVHHNDRSGADFNVHVFKSSNVLLKYCHLLFTIRYHSGELKRGTIKKKKKKCQWTNVEGWGGEHTPSALFLMFGLKWAKFTWKQIKPNRNTLIFFFV